MTRKETEAILHELREVNRRLHHLELAVRILKETEDMDTAALIALLTAERAETAVIGGKVDTLLAAIHNAGNVPQEVQDAANGLKADLDALNTKAG